MSESKYFLKIDGIPGESKDEKYKGEVELLSWSWGATQTGASAASGAGAGKVEIQPLQLVARSSIASPKLFLACANGKHFPTAILTGVRKTAKKSQEYMVGRFYDILISSYRVGASESNTFPTDEFSLNYTKVEFKYVPLKGDSGPVTATWDLKTNKGG